MYYLVPTLTAHDSEKVTAHNTVIFIYDGLGVGGCSCDGIHNVRSGYETIEDAAIVFSTYAERIL